MLLLTFYSGSKSQLYPWPTLKEAKGRVDLKNHKCALKLHATVAQMSENYRRKVRCAQPHARAATGRRHLLNY